MNSCLFLQLVIVERSFTCLYFRREGSSWDPSRLTSETLFVLGSKANKALGLGQTRGRLYMKHPELFKYSGDAEDKEWLTKNQVMSTTGGKAYLMVLQVCIRKPSIPLCRLGTIHTVSKCKLGRGVRPI